MYIFVISYIITYRCVISYISYSDEHRTFAQEH